MKYKLLSVYNGPVQNIGDYIQALAASQYLPSIDGFVNREELSKYSGDTCKIIMNGWFMHHPENWPPSDKIIPLFVAFHLNESVKDKVLIDDNINYLKRHEPIGCRDFYTASSLKNAGIESYFSGCLTLTLGNKYKSIDKSGDVIIVDPMIPGSKSIKDLYADLKTLCLNFSSVYRIFKKMNPNKRGIIDLIYATRFYRCYSKWVDKTDLQNAIYIQQESDLYVNNYKDDNERLKEAERLVRLYSKAKYVLTSRIHCALPCLGLETPVYFAVKDNMDFISSCRMGGLIELFNVLKCSKSEVIPAFTLNGVISKSNIIKNKEDWKPLAENLSATCMDFILSKTSND